MAKKNKELKLDDAPLRKKVALLSGDGSWRTHSLPKYQIPSITMNDGPAGLRKPYEGPSPLPEDVQNNTYKATCFPSAALNACSWDPDLMEAFGVAVAEECKERGTNVVLAPGVNIKRNPLGGRNFEYFSEDPYLSGKMAAAFINGCQSEGVGTCIKHFALNEQETRRFTYTAEVDDRALHEIYLKPFEIAIKEANPWMVMASYNRINGVYATENKYLLKDVLKTDWHYDGVVVSDWGAVNGIVEAHKNGLDLEMPCLCGKDRNTVLYNAIRRGQFKSVDFKNSISRLSRLIHRCSSTEMGKVADYQAHHALAKKMAERSIVLAQNDNILPLHNYDDVCVIGAFAEKPRCQAGGSSHVEAMNERSFLDVINEGRENPVPYEPGYSLGKTTEEAAAALSLDAADLASTHKKVILFLGIPERDESEGFDKETMRLPNDQYNLFDTLYAQNNNIVVVLCSGSPVEIGPITRARAIVITYLYGEAGSEALSDILTGLTNPSGKLAESWPVRYLDVPSATFYPGNNDFSLYKESVFVGYRYYTSTQKKVQFPFGFGLSYTRYTYSDLVVDSKKLEDGKKLKISFTVKNDGGRNGEEIVQLYISPKDPRAYRPKRELKAFKRIALKVEESAVIEFVLSFNDFSYWDRKSGRFVVEDGDYTIEIGASSENIRLSRQVHVMSKFEGESERFILPNYYALSTKRPFALVDDEFDRILGRHYVNDLPNKSRRVTLNSTFKDISDTSVGKSCLKAFKKKASGWSYVTTPEDMERECRIFLNTPIRCIIMGGVSDKKALALVALANHRPLKALYEIIRGKRK